jgi:predicted N-acyltransferase
MSRAAQDHNLKLRTVRSISEIDKALWERFRRAVDPAETDHDNPFLSYQFLSALEDSGCVGGRTGWQPSHLVLEDESDSVLALAPAYLKSHSMGEYVFDQSWAEAFARAGGQYYPKLQLSVPFTPVTGPRLLADSREAKALLANVIPQMIAQTDLSSAHLTFLPGADVTMMESANYLIRTDQQFHFFNEDYKSFDEFLDALASRKRKNIKRERRDAIANDIIIEQLTGRDIQEHHWDAFFEFYMDTGARKWGRPYLNRLFFSLIGERMAEKIALIMAKRDGRYIAGAINFLGAHTLYGRNWGAIEEHPFLHFEVCYYQAIDYAITHGLKRVEAGAQGEHKLARGYRPVTTYSAHYIANEGLRHAVADYLESERLYVERANDALSDATPFRKGERLDEAE